MNVPSRARFLAAAAGLGAVSASPALAQSETHISVIAVPIDISAAPFFALDEGIFKKHGLDAEVSQLGNGAQVLAAVVAGKVDFGAGGTASVALAHERGLPVVMVAPSGAYSSAIRSHGLVVPADSPIRSPKDLNGKTIATAGLKTIGDVALHAWFAKNGVDAAGVKLIEMPYGTMLASLSGAKVDAADLEVPYLDMALAQGARFVANVFDAIAPEWIEGAFFCTLDYAKAHPDVVRRFGDAIAEAGVWAKNNPAEAWNILDKYTKTTTPPGRPHVVFPERLRAADIQRRSTPWRSTACCRRRSRRKSCLPPGTGD